ncbi:uncharacterized protein PV09_02774 [Verruconis gallopava]|uniref:HIT-type domain-containing protein n=1 Tax=Verruconis gallopava TaxID=253628 RepID=A0A0D2B4Z8_9PEZI|nr:uncharacterized protein PV09_02774 [Verruconis gallopava]KIW06309.1 hypothetical protein PV09_02774 [Verruconis gallopava]
MNARKCEVCHDLESKYKCPQCELRYCSLNCFKLHKQLHESSTDANASSALRDESSAPSVQPHRTQQPAKVDPYTALEEHPNFQILFKKYPDLKSQLSRVYQATMNPSQQDESSLGVQQKTRDRVRGQWTQEKGDELAAKLLAKLAKEHEGVKEFMALVRIVFDSEEEENGSQEG